VDSFGASLAYPGKKAFLAFVETQVRRQCGAPVPSCSTRARWGKPAHRVRMYPSR
jgi:hypothetical protein